MGCDSELNYSDMMAACPARPANPQDEQSAEQSAIKLLESKLKWLNKQVEYEDDQTTAHKSKAEQHAEKAREYRLEYEGIERVLTLLRSELANLRSAGPS